MDKKIFFSLTIIFFALCLIPCSSSSAFGDDSQMSKFVIQLDKELDNILYSLIFQRQKEQGTINKNLTFNDWKGTKEAEAVLKEIKGAGRFGYVEGTNVVGFNYGGSSIKTLRIESNDLSNRKIQDAYKEITDFLFLAPVAKQFTRQLNEKLDERLYELVYGNLKVLGKLDSTITLESWKKTEQARMFLKAAKDSGEFEYRLMGSSYLYQFSDKNGDMVGDKRIRFPEQGVLTSGIIQEINVLAGALINKQPDEDKIEPPPKQYMARGMAAAKLNDWKLAIKYFTQAYEENQEDPASLFNLALANDNYGGRDLPAIALYNLYLSKYPTASNASEVLARILELEIRLESTTRNLLEKVKKMTDEFKTLSGNREEEFTTGNYDFMYDSERRMALAEIAKALAWLGDIDEALNVLDETLFASDSISLLVEIAEISIRCNNLSAAREVLDLAENKLKDDEKQKQGFQMLPMEKVTLYSKIVFLRHLAKDSVGVRSAMASCKEAMKKEMDEKMKNNNLPYDSTLASYAEALAWAGNIEEALETAEKIKNRKEDTASSIARIVAISGDLGKAKELFLARYKGFNPDNDFKRMLDDIHKSNAISEQGWEVFANNYSEPGYGKEYGDLPQFLSLLEKESKTEALRKLSQAVHGMAHDLYLYKNKVMGYLPCVGY